MKKFNTYKGGIESIKLPSKDIIESIVESQENISAQKTNNHKNKNMMTVFVVFYNDLGEVVEEYQTEVEYIYSPEISFLYCNVDFNKPNVD